MRGRIAAVLFSLLAWASVADAAGPDGYWVIFLTSPVTAANQAAVSFLELGGQAGDAYHFRIYSSNGGAVVEESGTQATGTPSFTRDLSALPDGTLTLEMTLTRSGVVGQTVTTTVVKETGAPAGYAVAFNTPEVNSLNQGSVGFTITKAEVGATYFYRISSSGGGTPVEASGVVASATQIVSGVNLSALPDGALTLYLHLTDTSGNVGVDVTAQINKSTAAAPTGYTATFDDALINGVEQAAIGFHIHGATTGALYRWSIASSGGGATLSNSATVVASDQAVSGINVSGLADGVLTLKVTLEMQGLAGAEVQATTQKDTQKPSGYAVAFGVTQINAANQKGVELRFSNAEVGAGYRVEFTSSGGGTTVVREGTISQAAETLAGLDLSSLPDGVVTARAVLTDIAGNVGDAVTTSLAKSATAPSGYSVMAVTTTVNQANQKAFAFQILNGKSGNTYSYVIQGGGATRFGSGVIGSAIQLVSGVDLSGLPDGTIQVSVTLSDAAGNSGVAAQTTVLKDTIAPSGYQLLVVPATQFNYTAYTFEITSGELGARYGYAIASSNGGSIVTGEGVIASAPHSVMGINLAGVADGLLTVQVWLLDAAGNNGGIRSMQTSKDTDPGNPLPAVISDNVAPSLSCTLSSIHWDASSGGVPLLAGLPLSCYQQLSGHLPLTAGDMELRGLDGRSLGCTMQGFSVNSAGQITATAATPCIQGDQDGDGVPNVSDNQPLARAGSACTAVDGRVSIADTTYGGFAKCTASREIATGTNVNLSVTADVTFQAGEAIRIFPGMRVVRGGRLHVRAGGVARDTAARSAASDETDTAGDAASSASVASSGQSTVESQAPRRLAWDQLPTALRVILGDVGNGADFTADAAGHWVVFASAVPLLPSDDNGISDIYLYRVDDGALMLVSANRFGVAGNGPSGQPEIDGAGRYIVYASSASNLIERDVNGVSDIFLYDLDLAVTERIGGADSVGDAANPGIGGEQPRVVFDRVEDDGVRGVHLYDHAWPAVGVVSLGGGEEQIEADRHHPAISSDGQYMAYVQQRLDADKQSGCSVELASAAGWMVELICPDVMDETTDLRFDEEGALTLLWVAGDAEKRTESILWSLSVEGRSTQ